MHGSRLSDVLVPYSVHMPSGMPLQGRVNHPVHRCKAAAWSPSAPSCSFRSTWLDSQQA